MLESDRQRKIPRVFSKPPKEQMRSPTECERMMEAEPSTNQKPNSEKTGKLSVGVGASTIVRVKYGGCGHGFDDGSHITMHQSTHSEERPFVCRECERDFTRKSDLIRHQRTHSGERPFVCTECERGFTQKSHLILHQSTHSGEKSFVCRECEQGFMQKSDLIRHQRRHSGEKPFVCKVCERGFTRKLHLIMHQETHSEEPFVDRECESVE